MDIDLDKDMDIEVAERQRQSVLGKCAEMAEMLHAETMRPKPNLRRLLAWSASLQGLLANYVTRELYDTYGYTDEFQPETNEGINDHATT